jgi:hypothetical protein
MYIAREALHITSLVCSWEDTKGRKGRSKIKVESRHIQASIRCHSALNLSEGRKEMPRAEEWRGYGALAHGLVVRMARPVQTER